MVFVIFEGWPEPAHRAGYLKWAAELSGTKRPPIHGRRMADAPRTA
jgi:hypothetical protein